MCISGKICSACTLTTVQQSVGHKAASAVHDLVQTVTRNWLRLRCVNLHMGYLMSNQFTKSPAQ
jgi:flagellar biosynthesis/type III secretory pathway chaperone